MVGRDEGAQLPPRFLWRAIRGVGRRLGAGRLRRRLAAALADPSRFGNAVSVDQASYASAGPMPGGLDVREWMAFRGALFAEMWLPESVEGSRIVAIAALFETETWERPIRAAGGLRWVLPIPETQSTPRVGLGVRCASGHRYVIEDPSPIVVERTSFASPHATFLGELACLNEGLVVELGSRNRSGRTYNDIVPPHLRHLGVDIVAGPNVDVVADAHELASHIEPGSADAVYSIATFEHLAMPWRCAVEINKVVKPGGVCFVLSHQTFPLHETPWDFFRFSESAWHALFNEATGFEIIDVAMGEAAAVTGLAMTAITWEMDRAVAYLGSSVTCRKIGETTLDWPVPLDNIVQHAYPAPAGPGS